MRHLYQSFKDFLLTFNYSNKVRFIIFLVIYSALCLQIMQVQYHNRFLTQLNAQKEGVSHFEKVNAFFQKLIVIYLSEKENLHGELGLMQEEWDRFFTNYLQLAEVLKKDARFDSAAVLSFNSHLSIGLDYWKHLKQNSLTSPLDESRDLILASIENTYRILMYLTKIYRLDVNFDIAAYFLAQVFATDLPQLQIALAAIDKDSQNPQLKQQDSLAKEMNLILIKRSNELIFKHIDYALTSNSFLQESFKDDLFPTQKFSTKVNKMFYEFRSDQLPSREHMLQITEASLDFQKIIISNFILLTEQQLAVINLRKILSTLYVSSGPFIVLALYMTRIIRRPISELKQAAERLSQGDLTVRIPINSEDEVSQVSAGFNKMLTFFEQVMRKAEKISSVLVHTTSSVFTNSKELESNVLEQEKAIKHILHNAKGVTKAVQEFSEFLKQANQSAIVTAKLANTGKENLDYMEIVMHQIGNASERMEKTLMQLQDKISAIQSIINTLIKIADQINLLSLNSAIRAGKQTKQFPGHAVIADKIRELADQTAFVTLNMEESVNEILSSVAITVQTVINFSSNTQKLMEEASQIQDRLKKIIGYTKSQVESFESIYIDMQGQVERVGKIEQTILHLTSSAQKTTTSVKNLYVEIEYLYHSTNNLQMMTKQFLQSPKKSLEIKDLNS